jgi:hypothetical protein
MCLRSIVRLLSVRHSSFTSVLFPGSSQNTFLKNCSMTRHSSECWAASRRLQSSEQYQIWLHLVQGKGNASRSRAFSLKQYWQQYSLTSSQTFRWRNGKTHRVRLKKLMAKNIYYRVAIRERAHHMVASFHVVFGNHETTPKKNATNQKKENKERIFLGYRS